MEAKANLIVKFNAEGVDSFTLHASGSGVTQAFGRVMASVLSRPFYTFDYAGRVYVAEQVSSHIRQEIEDGWEQWAGNEIFVLLPTGEVEEFLSDGVPWEGTPNPEQEMYISLCRGNWREALSRVNEDSELLYVTSSNRRIYVEDGVFRIELGGSRTFAQWIARALLPQRWAAKMWIFWSFPLGDHPTSCAPGVVIEFKFDHPAEEPIPLPVVLEDGEQEGNPHASPGVHYRMEGYYEYQD